MTRFDQSHNDAVDDPGHELGAEVPLHDGGEQQRVAADGAPVAAHAASHHRVAVVEVGEDLHQHLARQRPPAQLSHPPLLPGVGHSLIHYLTLTRLLINFIVFHTKYKSKQIDREGLGYLLMVQL